MHQVIEVLGKQISFIWEDPWVDVTILKIRKPTQQAIEAMEGSLILSPLLVAPVGLILGLIPLKKSRDNFAKWGVITNIILFLFPTLYMIVATLIGGV